MHVRFMFLVPSVLNALRAGEGDEQDSDKDKDSDSDKDADKDGDNEQDSEQDADKEQDSKVSKAALTAARNDAAKYRTQLRETQKAVKDLTAKVKTFEDANKSDLQKTQDALKELETKNAQLAVKSFRADGVAAAVRMNSIDPDAVAKLLEPDSEDDVDAQVKALVKSKPYLFKSSGNGDGGNGGERGREHGTKVSMNDLIRGKR